jgi:hypothetical protein
MNSTITQSNNNPANMKEGENHPHGQPMKLLHPREKSPPPKPPLKTTPPACVVIGEKCLHPQTDKPPQNPP